VIASNEFFAGCPLSGLLIGFFWSAKFSQYRMVILMRNNLQAMLPVILVLAVSNCPIAPTLAESAGKNAVAAKPLSTSVKRALTYLVAQQQENGGWSQGTESSNMGGGMDNIAKTANVGDTCMAGLALVQSGSYPNKGEYAKNLVNAAGFVCGKVEKSDDTSLSVTDLRTTRIQMKLGPNIDTFLASLFLTEIKGHMPNKDTQVRVAKALDKVIAKMERNQNSDGQFTSKLASAAGGEGWAPIHAQAIATKALNRAKQFGVGVSDETLAKAQSYAEHSYNKDAGTFALSGAANVPLYAAGAALSGLQQSVNTGRVYEEEAQKVLESKSSSDKDRREARSRIDRLASGRAVQTSATKAVTERLNDKNFIQGFGCNGGEEFLSYLDISEALKDSDPKKWQEFDSKMTENLSRIQNQDGSWMGQHCITSKTFVTAAAILVLTVDRESSSRGDKIRRHA
jgi:hypothetical protein